MKKLIVLLPLFLCLSTSISAQYADCSAAFELCSRGTYLFDGVIGTGQEADPIEDACGSSVVTGASFQVNTTWIRWTVETDGVLELELSADDENTDLDFMVFRLSADCSSKETIRCMYSGENVGDPEGSVSCTGPTGLRMGEEDTFEDAGCSEGDNNYLAPLMVQAGEVYALLVNDFSSVGSGFSLLLCGTATLPCDSVECSALTNLSNIVVPTPWQIAPNPSYDQFRLIGPQEDYLIRLVDQRGRVVLNASSTADGRYTLPAGLASGLYFAQILDVKGQLLQISKWVKL